MRWSVNQADFCVMPSACAGGSDDDEMPLRAVCIR